MRLPSININFERLRLSLDAFAERARQRREAALQALGDLFALLWYRGFKPVGLTGINILGYLLDKLLLGAPGLRSALGPTVILAHWNFQQTFQKWVSNNAGWNIYAGLDGPADNILGVLLGLGLGIVNYLTHTLTSLFRNTRANFNLLGDNGVFNTRRPLNDNRPLAIKIIFGMLTFPLVLPLVTLTNAVDSVFTLIKNINLSLVNNFLFSYNLLDIEQRLTQKVPYDDKRHIITRVVFGLLTLPLVANAAIFTNLFFLSDTVGRHIGLSIRRNIRATWNLLGDNGIFAERQALRDPRHLAVKILFGILSSPVVGLTIAFTNTIDLAGTAIYHFALSFGRNLRASYNLQGSDGFFGERLPYQDIRNKTVKTIFGILSGPFVAIAALATNTLNLGLTGIYNFALSTSYNVKKTFNLLGSNGQFGTRLVLNDARHLITKVVFGILSAPLVFVPIALTNTLDLFLTGVAHTVKSIYYNTLATYNLLGKEGVFPHYAELPEDTERHLALKIVFGIASSPVVAIASLVTNSLNVTLTFFEHLRLSTVNNLKNSYNLLGSDGVYGVRKHYEDSRGLAVKVIFGLLSAPIVALPFVVANAANIIATDFFHFGLSFHENLRVCYNLLGENGSFGPRRSYQDARSYWQIITYGLLSSPFVLLAAALTNASDLVVSTLVQTARSTKINIKNSYNLLGADGIYGARQVVADGRSMLAKVFFGILSAPVVAIVALASNVLNVALTSIKNWNLSFYNNLKASYNLLGKHGSYGPREVVSDGRFMITKVIFGVLSAPVVAVLALASNTLDLALTSVRHWNLSIHNNLKVTYNIVLGKNGAFGDRADYTDTRHLAVKVIFGLLSGPVVLALATAVNLLDLALISIKHTFISASEHIAVSFNVLGTAGMFGKRLTYNDDRHWAIRILFGLISLPLVVAPFLTTNSLDLLFTTIRHSWISFVRNIQISWNFLGKFGCFGPMSDYQDTRHGALRLIFGLVTLPAVAFISLPLNVFNLFLTTVYGIYDSLIKNVSSFYNLLGRYGSFGARADFSDARSWGEIIIFGLLSTPLVAPILLVTNSVDTLWTGLRHTIFNKAFMLPLAIFLVGAVIVLTTGLPALLFRKAVNGLNNVIIRPFKDDEGFQGRIFASGLLNVVTLGLFGLGKKLFKLATGYSNRFGFPSAEEDTFRKVIDMTKRGDLPACDSETHTPRDHSFRPVIRFFYGFRSEEEKVAKRYHDAAKASDIPTVPLLDDGMSDAEKDVSYALNGGGLR